MRKANPNTKHRTILTGRVRSARELEGLPTGGDIAAAEANLAHAELETSDARRQDRRHMHRLREVARLVNASGDKRRRPRGVTKAEFKQVRALKLTRTANIKKKARTTSHPRAR